MKRKKKKKEKKMDVQRDMQARVTTLSEKSRRMTVLATTLLVMLGVAVSYLTSLSAENYSLRASLAQARGGVLPAATKLEEHIDEEQKELNEPETEKETSSKEDEEEDDVGEVLAPLANATLSLLALRPHYSLFVPGPFNTNGTNPIALWIASPWAVYLLFASRFVSPALLVLSYAGLLVVVRLVSLCISSPTARAYLRQLEWSPGAWFRGVWLRLLVLGFLSAELTLEEFLPPWARDSLESTFVILFIGCCFLTGRTYLSLMWTVLISSSIQSIPFFRTTFSVFCPWMADGYCRVEIGKFFVASEFLLTAMAMPNMAFR